ncbi:malate dehydrogenase (quinone) [Tsukamurella sp. 8F]|uniref:malate dehydrogenase (quinone) n=1 Tax=unclassified Tsukamurella TaxID=2633480 RepID=UPI0023B8EBCF|nr:MULTISPECIES: malate dehydrogenase (quinone) [unclassified Tsukamurella]MDF0530257.1 malate dehydrogenase (quinone) [Tsukamurella sp. 8J]MDF0586574.1 malate dehydrogenase (quinone) [Tsukamurella sp. 8F]
MSSLETVDVALIGGGIMSATLGAFLRNLEPEWTIRVFERLPQVAEESSDAWNNAGTGHAALCELNYTPEGPDGSIDITKALAVNEQFQQSRQFWSYLLADGQLADASFINQVPHMTLVRGADDIDYLRRRFDALRTSPLFSAMRYSTDRDEIAAWAPLIVDGRAESDTVAATFDPSGTDVDFGSLTRQLLAHHGDVQTNREITRLRPDGGGWRLTVRNTFTRKDSEVRARFVFVGAGGRALQLLQAARAPEIHGYSLLPISGHFLRTTDPAVVERHHAKVYGKAPVGAPPMSMPHLDARVIGGERSVLFGPYAGANPKFLKEGSVLDMPRTLRPANFVPFVRMGLDNLNLVGLLLGDLTATPEQKLRQLKEFAPSVGDDHWEMYAAGQRAQIVKPDQKRGGALQFGTEVISSAGGTLAGLLGASPGASTAVPIALSVLERSFPNRFTGSWAESLRTMVPTFGTALNDDADLAASTQARTAKALDIEPTR